MKIQHELKRRFYLCGCPYYVKCICHHLSNNLTELVGFKLTFHNTAEKQVTFYCFNVKLYAQAIAMDENISGNFELCGVGLYWILFMQMKIFH
jgi:hypothetical protein